MLPSTLKRLLVEVLVPAEVLQVLKQGMGMDAAAHWVWPTRRRTCRK
jgi:hypothetical protein